MPWIDLLLAGIVLLSIAVGLVRGFVFEVMSLAGWLVAYLAARWLSPVAAPYLPIGAAGSPLNQVASFACTFLAALLLWSLLSRLVRMLVHATPLSVVDRLLGGLFGSLRGVLVLLLVALAVGLTPAARTAAWDDSVLRPWLQAALGKLKPLLPPQVSDHLSSAGRFRAVH
jgi:membrane protein required for colicin V production